MYTVTGLPLTRTMRVLWMLEELGRDYRIDVYRPHSEEARRANPGGKIPTLTDNGTVLIDSVAIVTYLADKHGDCTHPAGTLARGRQDSVTQFVVEEIEGPLWTASKNTFIHPEDKRCADIVPICRWEWDKAMKTLAAHIDGKEYITGDRFTVPDLLLGHCANWAGRIEFPIPEGPVQNYLDRVRARPALARAMERGKAEQEAAA